MDDAWVKEEAPDDESEETGGDEDFKDNNLMAGNSTGSSAHRRQSKSSNSENKCCRVCGDKALSVNFNVVTCESCKAFFRRNALKPKEFRCPFNGSCEITLASRKFCKKCRLRKCFEVGMMKEWIMSDEARLQKRQLIENNREKRRRHLGLQSPPSKKRRRSSAVESIFDSPPTTSCSMSSDERPPDTPSVFNFLTSPMARSRRGADRSATAIANADSITIPKSVLLNLINRCQQNSQQACLRCPPPPVLARARHLYENGGLDGLEKSEGDAAADGDSGLFSKCICSCACGARADGDGAEKSDSTNSMEVDAKGQEKSILDAALWSSADATHSSNQFGHADTLPDNGLSTSGVAGRSASTFPPFDHGAPNPFNGIHELLRARAILGAGLGAELGYAGASSQQQQRPQMITDPVQAVKTMHSYVRRLIEMNKTVSTFRSLTTRDQAALLQSGIPELIMLLSAQTYNHDMDAWLPFGRDQPYVMPVDIMKCLNADLFDQHINFIRSFAPQWSSDEMLMQLLAMTCLFDPNRPGIVDTQGVMRQQQFYLGLMKEYLLKLYGQQEGLRIFGELQNRLDWLRRGVAKMQPRYHLELSTEQDLNPLMVELLF